MNSRLPINFLTSVSLKFLFVSPFSKICVAVHPKGAAPVYAPSSREASEASWTVNAPPPARRQTAMKSKHNVDAASTHSSFCIHCCTLTFTHPPFCVLFPMRGGPSLPPTMHPLSHASSTLPDLFRMFRLRWMTGLRPCTPNVAYAPASDKGERREQVCKDYEPSYPCTGYGQAGGGASKQIRYPRRTAKGRPICGPTW